jgi:hypothetical protein
MKLIKRHELTHPFYDKSIDDWTKFRHVLEGGRTFVNKYLEMFSDREDQTDFARRKKMAYCPGHAEAALVDIRNTIYQRMRDIVRVTNVESFNLCKTGDYKGVDNRSLSMNSFMGRIVLTELLFLGRVGIFVDRSPLYETAKTKAERMQYHPYMYIVATEDILSWTYDDNEQLTRLLLSYEKDTFDEKYGLVTGTETAYKLFQLTDSGVVVTLFDTHMTQENQVTLDLGRIPFTILDTSRPLLKNIADYQVALLNMESSDVTYSIRGNFAFYTEQYDPRNDTYARGAFTADGDDSGAVDETTKRDLNVKTGHTVGRRYPTGTERPDFINPSPEPLRASMEKESTIRSDIRKLINLNLSTLEPTRASADSKKLDFRGLESGLSYIGMEIEFAERDTISHWAQYDNVSDVSIMVQYPTNYDPKSDDERIAEAEKYIEQAEKVTLESYRKEMVKHAMRVLLSDKIKDDRMQAIYDEIDSKPIILSGVKMIIEAHREGLVSDELAAKLIGYPEGDVKQAAEDHAKRAARIVQAQTNAANHPRGAGDLDEDKNSDRVQKEKVTDLDQDTRSGKRGEAQ